MSHFERMKKLFDDMKLPYTVALPTQWERNKAITQIIQIEEGNGYSGFAASFDFDKDGNFLEHSVFE